MLGAAFIIGCGTGLISFVGDKRSEFNTKYVLCTGAVSAVCIGTIVYTLELAQQILLLATLVFLILFPIYALYTTTVRFVESLSQWPE